MRSLVVVVVVGCAQTEPPYPDLEITRAKVHIVDAQVAELRLGFTFNGPFVDHGHVVATASIVDIIQRPGGTESWEYTDLTMDFPLGDDRWRPFDEMVLEDHGTPVASIAPFCNRTMQLNLNVSAQAVGDFHSEGSSAEIDGVPIECE